MDSVNLREVVLDILMEIEKEGTFSHLVINSAMMKYQYLDKNQRGFITRTAQGTIEKKIELDYIINQFSKVKVKKMKPLIRNLCEMSVYQLKYMTHVPASAVCNEAVKLAVKRKFQGLRGFVNGLLRNISRNMDEVKYPAESNFLEYANIKYSMPQWILKMWMEDYDKETVTSILEGMNKNKETYIRCNTSKISPEKLKEKLTDEGVTVEDVKNIPFAFAISGYDYLGALETFENGLFYVQDISSITAGVIANPEKDSNVIDVCAAPGGKSINAALLMDGTGSVSARDLTEYKTELIRDNVHKLGINNIKVKDWDARKTDESVKDSADMVIADVPCSGLGIIGRKPDIKYNASPNGLKELQLLQREILMASWEYVRTGGYLVYSTCTINREENEANVRWMTDNYPFELIEEKQFLPGIDGTDGFYVAKLRRVING